MRRFIPYVAAGVLVATIAIVIAVASDNPQLQASPSPSPSATPMSAQERCYAEVMDLLGQSLQAIQDGYTGGLDPNQVAARYGTDSPVFKSFSYSQAEMIGDVFARGSDGALSRIQPRVRQQCTDWNRR